MPNAVQRSGTIAASFSFNDREDTLKGSFCVVFFRNTFISSQFGRKRNNLLEVVDLVSEWKVNLRASSACPDSSPSHLAHPFRNAWEAPNKVCFHHQVVQRVD